MPNRTKLSVALEPVAGSRFQPTGFPDLGTGKFQKPTADGWVDAILVESEQSMANHLEGTGWDSGDQRPVAALVALPYVQVVDADGQFLTSSRTEAHRLSSAFIREGVDANGKKMTEVLKDRLHLVDDKPLSARAIAKAVFALDPACLVHGVFFADPSLPGQPKITRALTSFIEAEDVRPAEFGGVKKDDVRHKNADDGGSGEGYGSIPFHRTFWTARKITASFVLDLDQIASYGLSADATRLVEVLALWEMRSLLDRGLRLRTSCDLVPTEGADLTSLPALLDLAAELAALASNLGEELNQGAVLTVKWTGGSKGKKAKPKSDTPEDAE